jgi:hypothetical protein
MPHTFDELQLRFVTPQPAKVDVGEILIDGFKQDTYCLIRRDFKEGVSFLDFGLHIEKKAVTVRCERRSCIVN